MMMSDCVCFSFFFLVPLFSFFLCFYNLYYVRHLFNFFYFYCCLLNYDFGILILTYEVAPLGLFVVS